MLNTTQNILPFQCKFKKYREMAIKIDSINDEFEETMRNVLSSKNQDV